MTLFRLSIFTVIIFSCILLINSAMGQGMPDRAPFTQDRQMFGPPLFLYDTYCFLNQDTTANSFDYKFEVYIAFANDILQFIKERQGNFTAGYDLYVGIFDPKGNQVAEKATGKKISVQTFEATNDRNLDNKHHISFNLIPGRYKLVLDLTDSDTQKSLHREKEMNIEGVNLNQVSVSEILFADKVIFDSLKNIQEIIPNLNRNFVEPQSNFGAYFEIYSQAAKNNLKLIYTITDAAEQAVIRNEQLMKVDSKITPYLLDLSKNIKKPGRYTLAIQVEENDEKVSTKAKFSANWSNFEFSKLNMNTAIETLKEILDDKEYKFLEQAPDSVKEARFASFWKERDPTPDTRENELQQEFYRRIDFTNNMFTVNALDKEGWQTDRGKIYIKYGPPTDVERHQDQLNLPPYEIWFYDKIDMRFYFQDKSGVGDFQLVRME